MEVSPGLVVERPSLVCKLNKSLYGLKQVIKQWYEKLTEALYSRGYTHSMLDYSLFYKKAEGSVVFAAVYVDDVLVTDPSYYRKLIGKLNFLTNTRLDIAYSVQHLSQFMQSPREPHLKVAYHVLRYLKGDPTLGIFLTNNADYTVKAFCDSDWATCP
uniref:Uncharacterized mitochondrial protein AtMg00810-like n=1 Tax=Nicotiana tabacum TaxID=4097 RepID=A0A1S3XBT5_TOBAC|nr:PREDICTED: uncharacterized mitochondrial protein AtMg00810-like [Nicotiana tabacum]